MTRIELAFPRQSRLGAFHGGLLIPGAKQVKQGLRSLPFAFTDKTHNCCRREETKSGFFLSSAFVICFFFSDRNIARGRVERAKDLLSLSEVAARWQTRVQSTSGLKRLA